MAKAHISYDFMDRINISGSRLIAEVHFDHSILQSRWYRDFDTLFLGGKRLDTGIPYEAQLVLRAENHPSRTRIG